MQPNPKYQSLTHNLLCNPITQLIHSTPLPQLTVISLLTAGVELSELVELSGCIIGCGLKIDTLDLVASVNSVDLDASVDGAFVVFITCFV